MQAIAGISFVVLIGVSLAVGTRMLMLARRTRRLPEWALGLNLVLVMGVAYPGMILLEADLGWSVDVQRTTMILLNAVLNAGFFLLFVFTASVFRPGASWTRGVLAVAALLFVLHVVLVGRALMSVDDLALVRPVVTRLGLVALSTATAGYAWSTAEALAHWGRLRRRQKLGLVDPVLCDRMWLWAMMTGASLAGATANGVYLALGIDVLVTPSAMFVTSMTGLVQGIFLWLTFLPPAAYLAWVQRRASGAS